MNWWCCFCSSDLSVLLYFSITAIPLSAASIAIDKIFFLWQRSRSTKWALQNNLQHMMPASKLKQYIVDDRGSIQLQFWYMHLGSYLVCLYFCRIKGKCYDFILKILLSLFFFNVAVAASFPVPLMAVPCASGDTYTEEKLDILTTEDNSNSVDLITAVPLSTLQILASETSV